MLSITSTFKHAKNRKLTKRQNVQEIKLVQWSCGLTGKLPVWVWGRPEAKVFLHAATLQGRKDVMLSVYMQMDEYLSAPHHILVSVIWIIPVLIKPGDTEAQKHLLATKSAAPTKTWMRWWETKTSETRNYSDHVYGDMKKLVSQVPWKRHILD